MTLNHLYDGDDDGNKADDLVRIYPRRKTKSEISGTLNRG